MHAFRIGRLFGVDIRVDWSWVLIFLLLTWNLTAVFARWHPDWAPAGPLAVALVASLLFFVCVLLHELGHSIVAKMHGLRVRSITLFLFGGVSNIEHEPQSARAEFLTAIVGPFVSILLGAAFLATAGLVAPVSMGGAADPWAAIRSLGPLETLLMWLGPINIVIGIFNLIPAFPLDGGRVLHSIVWAVTGNVRDATRAASAVGQGIGWAFVVTGLAMSFGARVPFFGTGLVSGLWLAFIGWFVRGAAAQAYTRLAIDEALAGHTVEELMRRDGTVVPPELPLVTLIQEHLVRSDERAFPVVRDGRLLGLVSVSEVRSIPPAQWPTMPVSAAMRDVGSLVLATPQQSLAEAFEQLARQDIEQLPVLDDGRLVGMLQRRDVARWLELAWRPGASSAVRAGRGAATPGPVDYHRRHSHHATHRA